MWVEMKIISWNVRGLERVEKRKDVRTLVMEKAPYILCLQETKLSMCDEMLCNSLWGGTTHSFSYRPSVGASRGLLTSWNMSLVDVWSIVSVDNVVMIHGRFVQSNEEFYLLNVYATCDNGAKQLLWDRLSLMLQQLAGKNVCICGDFNAVRSSDERRSLRAISSVSDMEPFNRFIEENLLVDLPLCGRNYTWYKGDGSSMSRLDKFLLSEDWCLVWPSCMQVADLRGLSDHCPLFLMVNEDDWVPRPSRMLKCWNEVPAYKQFLIEKWRAFEVQGWGGFILQEKLKRIKLALKEWHRLHVSNLPGRITALKERIAELDTKGEHVDLSVDELHKLRHNNCEIHSLSRMNTSICWQQSCLLWLQDGDANSKYFHSVMVGRLRGNTISSLVVDGGIVEGVNPVREAVFNYFAKHFKKIQGERPSVEGLEFRRIDVMDGAFLVRLFLIDEVKVTVWDCDSYKSPGPDGINFGFIKKFWSEISEDIMRFVGDFNRNGKLTRGINSTFIALIPKVESPPKLNDFRPILLVGTMSWKRFNKSVKGLKRF